MAVNFRKYNNDIDFQSISDFLIKLYQPLNRDGNWFQAIWEYSCFHPMTDTASLNKIGIWEDNREIVATIIYDMYKTDISFCIHSKYKYLQNKMLEYAEVNMSGKNKKGSRFLRIFISDYDKELEELVKSKEYRHEAELDRVMSCFIIPTSLDKPHLPEGFKFKTLTEDNDIRKIHSVLHRGFDHPGEPPEDEIEDRKKMLSAPNLRTDLTIVVESPNGDFVTYCGMWHDKTNRFGYVEPVATDPDYRRMGLGSATVLESIRRCGLEGADIVYVWTDLTFYLSFGFKKLYTHNCWIKLFD